MINLVPLDDPATLVYRRAKNAGGLMSPRLPGENINLKTLGLDRIDEEVGIYSFADGAQTPASEIYGLKSPDSLDPSSMQAMGRVLSDHTQQMITSLSNTLRLFASRAFLPTITIEGVDYNNDHVESLDWSANPWSNTSTDILGQLLDLKQSYFGTNLETSSITIMLRTSAINDIIKNEGFIKLIGFDNGAALVSPAVAFPRIQSALAGFGINLIEWNDAYYPTRNSDTYNVNYFLPNDHVVIVPRGYWGGNIDGTNMGLITPRSTTAPFIDLVLAPDPDFKDKTFRTTNIVGVQSFGNIPGIYYANGWDNLYSYTNANKYVSVISCAMGLFVERHAGIKYVKVK